MFKIILLWVTEVLPTALIWLVIWVALVCLWVRRKSKNNYAGLPEPLDLIGKYGWFGFWADGFQWSPLGIGALGFSMVGFFIILPMSAPLFVGPGVIINFLWFIFVYNMCLAVSFFAYAYVDRRKMLMSQTSES